MTSPHLALSFEICDQARLRRDKTFDGKFFVAVRTTRIYCRPICPVRPPLSRNVVFFPSAFAAERAGYRPCLRCRPESAPGSAAWLGTGAVVKRALRLLDEGALDGGTVADLAARLGIGDRQLRRLFLKHVGATPTEVASTMRLQRALTLLRNSSTPVTSIAFEAGYNSVRAFNRAFKQAFGRPPGAVRRVQGHRGAV
jgi:AraC family transcriptional regulator of adaptative response / DNA-3-methyladenine glycosylase II